MSCKMTIEQICGAVESPLFDRKSARIDAKALAVHLIAFANADGGVIAVGVEDDGTITGIDSYAENINELLRAPFDFCKPSVRVETERLSCTNRNGKADHILLIEVLQSSDLHANQADEVFFRVGDKSKKLNFEERLHRNIIFRLYRFSFHKPIKSRLVKVTARLSADHPPTGRTAGEEPPGPPGPDQGRPGAAPPGQGRGRTG